ncbi:SDR family NAD(P)-dependent oxidoreductase [Lactiplantibacillus plantarum]|uniref:Short-chain dehydrogenase/oxidoreductase n=1 Tax=Lactiplantibacillus plantarum CMPG5300 TaxID=1304889 RepID=A0AAW3FKJ0_LACPN|nr:SDR family NAD(P)-dependent oxidoreductase [Lactiplantibacillus plantarum]ATI72430.1 short-chain dehydrogenase [Lactiplantibacillus plantarum]KGH41875.1 short-chain dehydrogenase/oxidoreductase [Lactiplantibacillus plantarum CMPG5300]MBO2712037.1 SDR family NAD(P)-dependent oxidoreductase [Lactiplantibacillus plantarum]MCG0911481.1 short-chain dehydrogenase/oxidoreductase [Lactiplantibacillus plantarum]MCZ2139593.1 SDR family NAD(P)-dependent oxidoreductase [Lactiplantibacillus plantarum]
MQSKLAVIIGGTSGVGKHTAIDLANQNYHVIIVGSRADKGRQAQADISQATGNQAVQLALADLSTKTGVQQFAHQLAAMTDHIDILLNSIGVMLPERHLSADGYDLNLVLNYLTHFWIIQALLPLLKHSDQARILLVGALPFVINHAKVSLPDFDAPATSKYNAMTVTAQATAARVLLTLALSERLTATNVTINIFHPGYVPDSNFGAGGSWVSRLAGRILGESFSRKNSPIGAWLATAPELTHTSGHFYDDRLRQVPLSKQYTRSKANDLWRLSSQY